MLVSMRSSRRLLLGLIKPFAGWQGAIGARYTRTLATPAPRTSRHNKPNALLILRKLYEDTSVRWIFNEKYRKKELIRVFNVIELARLAAESVNRTFNDVADFKKFSDGLHNRKFVVTMRDGFQLLVQIPYAWTNPRLAVASEVATMDYLRKHGIPVPRVYGYSNVDNPAGTEYIAMELIRGKTLADYYWDMGYAEQNAVSDEIVRFEARLHDLQFPASGGLYYRKDLPSAIKRVDINAFSGQFCIGPETAQCMWPRRRKDLTAERGPYRTSLETLIAGVREEAEHLKAHGRPLLPYEKILRQCVNYQPQSHLEYIDLLEKYIRAAPFLVPKTASLNRPVIRHPSLRPDRIIVTKDMKIKAVTDWQHTSIFPSFLQCGLPWMLPARFGDLQYLLKGEEPPDIARLGLEEWQETPVEVPGQTPRPENYYLDISKVLNAEHYNVMACDSKQLRQASYAAASYPWEGINMYLKTSLANLEKNWAELTQDFGNKDPCPFRFSDAEHEECVRFESAEKKARRKLLILGTEVGATSCGAVYPRYYKKAMRGKAELKAELLGEAKTDEERDKIREHFVFDDFCEDDYKW